MNRYALLPLGLTLLVAVAEPIEANDTSTSDQRTLVSKLPFEGQDVVYFRQLLAIDGEPQRVPSALRVAFGSRGATIENQVLAHDGELRSRFVDLAAETKTHAPLSAELFDTIKTNGAAIEITSDAIHIRGGEVEIRRMVPHK